MFAVDADLGIPFIRSANRPMNLMMQKNSDGNLVISVCDPTLEYDRIFNRTGLRTELKNNDLYNKRDPRHVRTLKITFNNSIEILKARSGLPESNPDLNARVEVGSTLSFETRDGISDTFVIKLE